MVVGQQNKVALVVQARMKSTRLPGKILMPIPLGNGKPLMLWIVNELKKLTIQKDIFIATSSHSENDILEEFCKINGIKCFRGSEDDVLSRFITIASLAHYDCIVRLTADNPIIDVDILEQVIIRHINLNNDYTKTEDLPIGMNFEIVRPAALLSLREQNLTDDDREHVTMFIRNNIHYKKELVNILGNNNYKALRLTVDYASDYTLISSLLSLSDNLNNLQGINLVNYALDKFPWLFDSNATNLQKIQHPDINDELIEASKFLESHDFKRSAKILRENVQ